MCQMMIVEMHDSIVAQPAIAPPRRHVKEILHVGAVRTHRLSRNPSQLLAFDMGPPLLAQPPPTAEVTEVLHRISGTADCKYVDVAPRRTDDAKRFLNRQVRKAAIALTRVKGSS